MWCVRVGSAESSKLTALLVFRENGFLLKLDAFGAEEVRDE